MLVMLEPSRPASRMPDSMAITVSRWSIIAKRSERMARTWPMVPGWFGELP